MSTLKVDTIQGKTTAGTVAMPSGSVVQSVEFARIGVVGSSLSSLLTIDSTSFADVMSKTITTKLANSKIFVSMNVVGFNGSSTLRVSTKIFSAADAGLEKVEKGHGGKSRFEIEYDSDEERKAAFKRKRKARQEVA